MGRLKRPSDTDSEDLPIPDFNDIKKSLEKTNQTHLLNYYDELDEETKSKFLEHLNLLNFPELQEFISNWNKVSLVLKPIPKTKISPLDNSLYNKLDNMTESQVEKFYWNGLEKIAKGQVAALLLAGGRGLRLGLNYPKVLLSLDTLSKKTLIQLFTERILKLYQLAERTFNSCKGITFYIMVSDFNGLFIKRYMRKHNYFGMNHDDIVFFTQGNMPLFNHDGKIIQIEKYEVAISPDGNGGVFKAMKNCRIIEDMTKKGILYVHFFSGDNVLTKVCDPVFLGYLMSTKAECGNKVIPRLNPSEDIALVCLIEKKVCVVEHDEIEGIIGKITDDTEKLIYKSGNILEQYYSVNFLKNFMKHNVNLLDLHPVQRKFAHLNKWGVKTVPANPDCIKLEWRVSDALRYSKSVAVLEVPRFTDFSAVKFPNNYGADCPKSARSDLYYLHRHYIELAGGITKGTSYEIAPLISYAGENLETICGGKSFQSPHYISEEFLSFICNPSQGRSVPKQIMAGLEKLRSKRSKHSQRSGSE